MITTLLIFGYLGILVWLLVDMLDFYKKTPGLTVKETLKLYFNFPAFLKIIIGTILVTVLINIALTQGGEWIIKYSTMNLIEGDTPADLKIYAIVLGMANQFLWNFLINFFSKNNHEIKTQ